jgi:hypothetical protein
MKELALAAILMAVSQSALAEPSKFDMCKTYGAYAKSVMQARQSNMPATLLYERASNPELGDTVSGAMNMFISLAYSKPAFSTDKYKQRAIAEFESDIVVSCMNRK